MLVTMSGGLPPCNARGGACGIRASAQKHVEQARGRLARNCGGKYGASYGKLLQHLGNDFRAVCPMVLACAAPEDVGGQQDGRIHGKRVEFDVLQREQRARLVKLGIDHAVYVHADGGVFFSPRFQAEIHSAVLYNGEPHGLVIVKILVGVVAWKRHFDVAEIDRFFLPGVDDLGFCRCRRHKAIDQIVVGPRGIVHHVNKLLRLALVLARKMHTASLLLLLSAIQQT